MLPGLYCLPLAAYTAQIPSQPSRLPWAHDRPLPSLHIVHSSRSRPAPTLTKPPAGAAAAADDMSYGNDAGAYVKITILFLSRFFSWFALLSLARLRRGRFQNVYFLKECPSNGMSARVIASSFT